MLSLTSIDSVDSISSGGGASPVAGALVLQREGDGLRTTLQLAAREPTTLEVQWGDGTSQPIEVGTEMGATSHDYPDTARYEIRLTGEGLGLLTDIRIFTGRLVGAVEGLAPLRGLVSLQLDWNNLTNLDTDFSDFGELEQLNLDGNSLSQSLDFSSAVGLTELRLRGNPVGIPAGLPGKSSLRFLELRETGASGVLDLRGCVALEELSAPYGGLTSVLGLGDASGLRLLSLYNNQLTREGLGDISALTQVTDCMLGTNQIAGELDVSHMTQLERLAPYNNSIESLGDLSGMVSLHTLRVHTNQLTQLVGVESLVSMTNLEVHNNQLSSLPDLSGLAGVLRVVHISRNQLSSLPWLGSLVGMTSLEADRNPLEDVGDLSGCVALENLRLYSCQLSSIGSVAGLDQLSIFRIDGNLFEAAELGLVVDQLHGNRVALGGRGATINLSGNPGSGAVATSHATALAELVAAGCNVSI